MYSFKFLNKENGVSYYSLMSHDEEIGMWCVEDNGDVGGSVSDEHLDTPEFGELESEMIKDSKIR